ncbi:hypothetical protein K458DRAFT_487172 [Lentithecium fluviatile CBS 122367]|uniref:BZIP domain-containing protein n=1 Tax=Lentithecium fluviatile CBS 122367 TaxID=1168545 RepID=A0A6G1J3Y5_9PLEO|nr:hypothetical protein K458DRAFT_487172 [Lentithecium fluviatile CBS 122367]
MASSSAIGARTSSIAEMWIRNEDDWSGISDPNARRRIQNRRNQRRLSTDREEKKGTAVKPLLRKVRSWCLRWFSSRQSPPSFDINAIADAIRRVHILDIESEHNRIVIRNFEDLAYRYYAAGAPAITLRPSLSQVNFIRALWTNVEVLGISSGQMSDDDAPSPFNSPDTNQAEASTTLASRLPVGLRPTDLQRVTLHHPWIDLLPIPEIRDNLFRRGFDFFDEEELCHDMRGRVHQDPGVLVWRDPWDPSGWEVTESFVRSWGWAVIGCWDLFHSTNKWRAQRGEKPLFHFPSAKE